MTIIEQARRLDEITLTKRFEALYDQYRIKAIGAVYTVSPMTDKTGTINRRCC